VTPIENVLFPRRAAAKTEVEKPPVLVKAAEAVAAAPIDAHSAACSVCKRVDLLERTLLVFVSVVVSSLLTALVAWRLLRNNN